LFVKSIDRFSPWQFEAGEDAGAEVRRKQERDPRSFSGEAILR